MEGRAICVRGALRLAIWDYVRVWGGPASAISSWTGAGELLPDFFQPCWLAAFERLEEGAEVGASWCGVGASQRGCPLLHELIVASADLPADGLDVLVLIGLIVTDSGQAEDDGGIDVLGLRFQQDWL